MSKTSRQGAFYYKVKPSAISPGWSNEPNDLSLDYYVSGVEADMREPFKSQLEMPNLFQLLWIEKMGFGLLIAAMGSIISGRTLRIPYGNSMNGTWPKYCGFQVPNEGHST